METLIFAVVLLAPALVLAALQWWAVRLVRRGAAPKWATWVLPALVVTAVVASTGAVLSNFSPVAPMAPADKATVLAASIAETANTVAFFGLALSVGWLGVLAYFARRTRPT